MNEESEDFKKKMEELREHFGGLVSEETLRLLASYSLGCLPEIDLENAANFRGKVTVSGEILKVYGVRDFSGSKGEGTFASILLKLNDSKEKNAVRAVFWNNATKAVENLSEGDRIRLRGYVRKRDENVEISVNSRSDVEILEKKVKEIRGAYIGIVDVKTGKSAVLNEEGVHAFNASQDILKKLEGMEYGSSIKVSVTGAGRELNATDIGKSDEEFKIEFTPVSELIPLKNSNLKGRVSGFGEIRSYKKRTLAEIYLSDESGRVKLILWDDNISIYRKADIGDVIEVYGGYPKIGWNGEPEVHCGWNCIVMLKKA
jgi:replication factor A1